MRLEEKAPVGRRPAALRRQAGSPSCTHHRKQGAIRGEEAAGFRRPGPALARGPRSCRELHVDITGAELASEVVHDGRLVLLVFLVRGETGNSLELGAWSTTTAGKLAPPPRPLVFSIGTLDRLRALAEHAVEALPGASYGEDGMAVLARDGELAATAMRASDGTHWVSLGWADDTGPGHGSGCWDREFRPRARGGGA